MDWGALTGSLGAVSVPVAALAVVLGLVNCFFGYRIFRILLGVYGFLLGAAVGFVLAGVLFEGQGWWVSAVGALAGGLLGAALMAALYYVGVFVVGAVTGAMLAGAVGAALGVALPGIVTIVVAIVVGIAAIFFQRVVIVLATSLAGAWMAVIGGYALMAGQPFELGDLTRLPAPWQRSLLPLAIWLVLAIAGAVVQFRTTKGRDEKDRG
jgi:hypothetical protein